jgi:hypothetical protein
MPLSIRIPAEDEQLLEQAAQALSISKSEFVRRSVLAYAEQVTRSASANSDEIDARFIGQGGGLRDPASVKDPQRRAIVKRLRAKHGYAG